MKFEKFIIDGQEIAVEVAETKPDTGTSTSMSAKSNTSASPSVLAHKVTKEDIEGLIRTMVTPAKAALDAIAGAKERSVELSLGLKGEVGFFLAKGEANAAIKITVKW